MRISAYFRVSLIGLILLSWGLPAYSANMWVYSINLQDASYVTSAPYVQWNTATIQSNPANWVSADQFFIVQTDQLFNTTCRDIQKNSDGSCKLPTQPVCSGNVCWGIQIYTDNTQVANGKGTFNLPDYFIGSTFVAGGTQNGSTTPSYSGSNAFQDTNGNLIIDKNGLVSNDGAQRLSLIWRIYDFLPDGPPFPKPVITQPGPSGCDFSDCAWFYLKDKGDLIQKKGATAPMSNWTDRLDYGVPFNQYGGQYAVNSRWEPTGDYGCDPTQSGCTTSEYLFFGSNFRFGTRQLMSTTIYIELITG